MRLKPATIGFLVVLCNVLPRESIAQERLLLEKILELPAEDTVTFDPKTIIEECTGQLQDRTKLAADAIAKALRARCTAYITLGEYTVAARDIEELIVLEPRNADLFALKAEILSACKKPGDAEEASNEAVRLAPQSPIALLSTATRMLERGQSKASLEVVDKAIALEPKCAPAYYMRAQILHRADSKKCIEAINRFLELSPDFLITARNPDDILLMRGFSLAMINRPREALSNLLTARKLNGRSQEIASQLAATYADLARYRLAAHYEAECIRMDATCARYYGYAAFYNAKAGYEEKALEAARKAVALGKRESDVLSVVGSAYSVLGRYTEAHECYDKAIKEDSEDPWARMRLASFLATCPDPKHRNGQRAVDLARTVYGEKIWRDWQKWEPAMVLAEALAETREFGDAVRFAKLAIEIAGPQFGRREEFLAKLAAFEKQMPWRAMAPRSRDERR